MCFQVNTLLNKQKHLEMSRYHSEQTDYLCNFMVEVTAAMMETKTFTLEENTTDF